MDISVFQPITQFLSASGPYGLVAILGWAIWRQNERKDTDMRTLYERVITLSEDQTAAIAKMESALTALKDALTALRPS